MAAAFGSNIYRVTVQNGVALNAPLQEFWYDQTNRRWSGPHTCTFSSISAMRNFFVGQLAGDTGVLARSDILQSAASTFVEGGAPMTFGWRCAMLPDTDRMAENSMVETTLMMSLNTGDLYTVTAIDQNNSAFDVLTLAAAGQSTVWGAFQWGQAVWGGAQSGLAPQQLAWSMPIVFRRLAIDVVGKSSGVLRIGALHLRYEELGYLQQTMAGA
jgi:hypothetical protein